MSGGSVSRTTKWKMAREEQAALVSGGWQEEQAALALAIFHLVVLLTDPPASDPNLQITHAASENVTHINHSISISLSFTLLQLCSSSRTQPVLRAAGARIDVKL